MKKHTEISHQMSMWTTSDHLSLADLTRSQIYELAHKKIIDLMEVLKGTDPERRKELERRTEADRRSNTNQY